MEPQIRYARTSDGVDIAYATAGAGPPVLVVRPLLRLAVDDELAPDDLGPMGASPWLALAERRTVTMLDHRGFGLSSGSEPEFTLDSSVRDLASVADALGADTIDLLGHLSPSHTALAYAARYPTRVRRLALWNPAPPGASMRASTLAGLPDIVHSHFREYVQLAALRSLGWERGAAARRWVEYTLRQFTPDSWERIMTQLEQLDATPELANLSATTLVVDDLSGPAGSIRTADAAQRFRRRLAAIIPNAQLRIIKPGSDQHYVEIVARFFGGELEPEESSAGTAVILFADIVESTAMTERMGNAAFRERSTALETRIRAAVQSHGGSAVAGRTLGDGVLATFTSASEGIAAALECAAAGGDLGLALHLGLHAGDVLREDGNVHGIAVSLASRVSALAEPNEILVSQTVRDLARASAGVAFEDRGERELKGVADPVRVYAVMASDRA